MKKLMSTRSWMPMASLVLVLFSAGLLSAQNCSGLPAVPDNTVTAVQDRDYMMCQLGRVFPTLPTRQGTAWPWNDPTAPTNAWPTNLSNPEGNWTDKQGHVIVRTAWGNWHTYDAESQYEPDPGVHYPNIPADKLGGAMSGYGDYGPFSNPRYTDIDLLTLKGGAPVEKPEDWWLKRRPEIFNFVQQELYGTPIDPTIPINWTIALGGTGTITATDGLTYQYQDKTFTGIVDISSYPALRNTPRVTATCRYPALATKRVPVVITYGEGTSKFTYTAPYGVGTCSYSPTAVQPDSGNSGALSSYIIGLVNKGAWRKPSDPGTLVAWGWGVSRLIDAFSLDSTFDPDKVGVEGHSRYGKATLVTGAYDDRVTVTWPSDAGAMGTAMARRTYGETLDFVSSSSSEYHWLAGAAMNYAGSVDPDPTKLFPRRVENLDVDAHSTTSLVAPRAFFASNGTDTPAGFGDAWADPRGCYLSGRLASPVWELLGWPGQVIPEGTLFTTSPGYTPPAGCANIAQSGKTACDPSAEAIGGTPPFDQAFISGTVGWRRQKEGHTSTPNWPSFMLFASRYLNDGRPEIPVGQSYVLGTGYANVVGQVQGTDPDSGDKLQDWQVKGGNGAYKFAIDPATGVISIAQPAEIDYAGQQTYTLTLLVGDGKLPSHDQTVTITIPTKLNVCHNGHAISVSKDAVLTHVVEHGDPVGSCQ